MNTKTIIFIILALVIIAAVIWIMSRATKAPINDAAQPEEEDKKGYKGSGVVEIEPEESKVRWAGRKPLVSNYTDYGVLSVKEGSVEFDNGEVVGGSIVFDMSTIAATSTGKGSGEDMLSRHLKSEDFFNVEEYPEATLEIESVTESEDGMALDGMLTIKGITQPVSFPVEIYEESNQVRAKSKVELDRTLWDIRYGSDKFFDNLGDKLISDTFTVEFDVVGETQS